MKILFVGQRGVPALIEKARPERRVQALAQALAEGGHDVAVTCARPFVSRNISRFNGVELVHLFSLPPALVGRWVRTFLELVIIWWRQSDVVHVHGWKLAALCRVAAFLAPRSTFVWTVDAIPSWPLWIVRLIARSAAKVFEAVTVPTRALQYVLARDLRVATDYVPDGYASAALPNIPLKHFGLRHGQQYVLTLAGMPQAARAVARAYAQAGLRRKLVVLKEREDVWARLAKRFPFLHFAGEQSGRALATLLAQAAVVIVNDDDAPHDAILQAMGYGRAVVATTPSPAEEVLGGAALFVKADDTAGLTTVLKSVVGSYQRQAAWGAKAQRRARAHFTWSRIVPEYVALYHYPRVKSVALDSARQTFLTELPAVR